MHAFRYHAVGRASSPRVEDVPVPAPAAGEVLVRVGCASLNPVDWKIAAGKFRLLVKGGLPRTMGSDFSGAIAAVGPGVEGWSVGDRVMGFVDPFARPAGTFAEYVPVPAGFAMRRPTEVDDVLGAALPCVGVTAVALCDLARVSRGSRVLVNGASGGVGHMAVQVAKARGGHYASTVPNAWSYTLDPLLNRFGRLERHAVMLRPSEPAMTELLRCLRERKLRCEVAEEFPLENVAHAIELSRAGRVAGKLVIRVA
jgi:NADPH:quinone reductase-like Zn-dependent oxidoreductase